MINENVSAVKLLNVRFVEQNVLKNVMLNEKSEQIYCELSEASLLLIYIILFNWN